MAIPTPATTTATTIRTRVRRPGTATVPKLGRSTTNNATDNSTTNTTGRYAAGGTAPANAAPNPAQSTANTAAGPATAQSIFVRRAYVTAAVAVPAIAANLFVPNAVAGGIPGAATNNAGSSNKPPPPTTASTHPATAAAASRVDTVNGSNSTGGILPTTTRPPPPAVASLTNPAHPHERPGQRQPVRHRPRSRRTHNPTAATATNSNIEQHNARSIGQLSHKPR